MGALVNEAIRSGKYTDGKGKPLTLNSPQAENLARAILYDELKAKTEVKRSMLQNPNIRNNTIINVGGGSKDKQSDQIDLREYSDTNDGGKDIISLM